MMQYCSRRPTTLDTLYTRSQSPCSGLERNLFLERENRDVVVFAEAAHALLRPSVAMPRRLARTIEEARDLSIWHQTRQLTQERYRILRRRPMVPADSIQSQLDVQCSVVSAPPVQNHADDCAFLAHHDLVERCAQDPLA
jgi:hypothetical protein